MKYILIFCIFLLSACKEEVKYSKEGLYAKAKAADSSTTFILPKGINAGPSCVDYAEGCLSAHIVQVRKLDLIAVEFMTEDQAIYAAKKVKGYYIRNWMLDDVTGEPTLERFAEKSLEAKKP
jgi:hypothetical protein